jgi:hypothetical protein
MNKKNIYYYDWSDIKLEICKEMNIREEDFRDYHKVVGGPYKDLWHEWLKYFDDEVKNDTIVRNDLGECIESKISWIRFDNKDWLEPFIRVVYKVWENYDIKYIKYYW